VYATLHTNSLHRANWKCIKEDPYFDRPTRKIPPSSVAIIVRHSESRQGVFVGQ